MASDAEPVAWCGVTVVPGGESGVRVIEEMLDALEIETFLVEREGE